MDETVKQIDPLALAIYEAAAEHLNADFQDPRSLTNYLIGQHQLIPHVDLQQVVQVVKAVCGVVGPICEGIEQIDV